MPGITDNLDTISETIRRSFTEKDTAREHVLPLCRDVIRYSSRAIRAVHRQELAPARELLASAKSTLTQAKKAAGGHDELENTGFFRDAQKEYSEAAITIALVTQRQVPPPEELLVEYAPYLNGMGEAVGELRRFILDGIRREDYERSEELLTAMDDIYNALVTMDYPDAITGGLRRTTDMVRGVLEKTRSDLTLIMRQNKLEARLKLLETKLKQ